MRRRRTTSRRRKSRRMRAFEPMRQRLGRRR